jgi:deoxyribodipyrimidine photolyase
MGGSSVASEGKTTEKKKIISVHWFRHGLRLHDNPALQESLKNADEFYPVFIFDGTVAGKVKFEAHVPMEDV